MPDTDPALSTPEPRAVPPPSPPSGAQEPTVIHGGPARPSGPQPSPASGTHEPTAIRAAEPHVPAAGPSHAAPPPGPVDATVIRGSEVEVPATVVPIAVPPGDVPPPPRIGRFEVRRELGRGGMGVVYHAHDPHLKREVAVKLLPAVALEKEELVQRFRQEAEAVARLNHPNLVSVYEVGTVEAPEGRGRVPYYAMEYVAGRNLAEAIRERGRFAPAEAMRVLGSVARGVACAHAAGVIHRDIKPENVLLADGAVGKGPVPKLTDFGLARVSGPSSDVRLTATQVVMGTPAYMAPEQASGGTRDVDERCDVYGLGAVLYETLCGHAPYTGETSMEVVMRKLREDPAPLRFYVPTLSADVQTIVLKAMEREPSRRYASAADLADDLDRCLNGEAIRARPPTLAYRAGRWAARNPWLAGLAAAFVVASAAISWLLVEQVQRARRQAGELEAARAAALRERAERRARALPHHLHGEDGREKARLCVRINDLALRAQVLQDADTAYTQATEADPEFAEAWHGRGRVRADLGDLPGAIADLERAVIASPGYVEAYLARLHIRTLEYETLWTKSGKIRDMNFEALTAFPDLRGDPIADRLCEQIRGDVRRVLELGVKPEEAAYFQGWLRRIDGDRAGALACFEDAIRIWPHYAAGYEGRAQLNLITAKPDLEAVQRDLKIALRLDPGAVRALAAKLYLRIRRQDYLGGLAEMQTLMQLVPRFAPLYVIRGYARSGVPGQGDGSDDMREALRLDPTCILARLNLGGMLHNRNEFDQAIAEYDAALAVNPRHALVLSFRAASFQGLGRHEQALADLDVALRIDPEFHAARRQRARWLLEQRRYDAALEDIRAVMAADPDRPESMVLLIDGFVQAGRPAEALAILDARIAAAPGEAWPHYYRGGLLLNIGRPKEAAAEFEQALAGKLPAPLANHARTLLRQAQAAAEKGK